MLGDLVSVITVTRNNAAALETTLRSIATQSYQPREVIVIDGASSDHTPQVIAAFDNLITRFISEPDEGIYDAMNKGLALAKGQWLVFMNAGDCFDSAQALQSAMAHSAQADVVYSDAVFLLHGQARLAVCSHQSMRVIHQAVVYRRELHARHGDYLSIPGVTVSDYLFLLSIAGRRWVKSPTVIARCDGHGVSSNARQYRQKLAADLLAGRRGPCMTGLMLLAYPLYRALLRPLVRILQPDRI